MLFRGDIIHPSKEIANLEDIFFRRDLKNDEFLELNFARLKRLHQEISSFKV